MIAFFPSHLPLRSTCGCVCRPAQAASTHVCQLTTRSRRAVGLLPKPFSAACGGTRCAPPALNSANQGDARLVLPDLQSCHGYAGREDLDGARLPPTFRRVMTAPFVDQARSPAPFRLLWVPRERWTSRNYWTTYALWVNDALRACAEAA